MSHLTKRATLMTSNYALMICRQPAQNKWLIIQECKSHKWWCPGGACNQGETFTSAAVRECQEEAGILVRPKRILKIHHAIQYADKAVMRVIFYGESTKELNKQHDSESLGAQWVTVKFDN